PPLQPCGLCGEGGGLGQYKTTAQPARARGGRLLSSSPRGALPGRDSSLSSLSWPGLLPRKFNFPQPQPSWSIQGGENHACHAERNRLERAIFYCQRCQCLSIGCCPEVEPGREWAAMDRSWRGRQDSTIGAKGQRQPGCCSLAVEPIEFPPLGNLVE